MESDSHARGRARTRLSVASGAADPATQTRPSVRMGSRADAVSGPLAPAR